MDPNILKTLGLNSTMSPNDLELLSQILNSSGNKGKIPKMSPKDRNNLISKLSSSTTLNEEPQKELKDMNDDEKIKYRLELKKKLKNKLNEKKMLRTNNFGKNNLNSDGTMDKLKDMVKNIDPSNLSQLLNTQSMNPTNIGEEIMNIKTSSNNIDNDQINKNIFDEDIKKKDVNTIKNIEQMKKITELVDKNYANNIDNECENIDENIDDYIN